MYTIKLRIWCSYKMLKNTYERETYVVLVFSILNKHVMR